MFQPGVGDMGLRQVERLESGQGRDVLQPCIGHFHTPQVQLLESPKPLQMFQPGVGDMGLRQVQRAESGQTFEVLQPRAGDVGSLEIDGNHRLARALFVNDDLATDLLDGGNHACLVGTRLY